MRKRHTSEGGCRSWAVLLGVMCLSSVLAYAFVSPFFSVSSVFSASSADDKSSALNSQESCCRGVENLELWGKVAVWGDKHLANSSQECCSACKAHCKEDGVCVCNSWVFCGDEKRCGARFRECWLKNQDDPLNPEIQASGPHVMWTSGLLYGKDAGVVGIETGHGTIRIKLLVDCAPYSVAYLFELQKLRHCSGCHIYRAEGRGTSWNEAGDQIGQTTEGPYGLVQGSLAVATIPFKELPREACPVIERGSVGWIEGGPDFFISLANHDEWYPKHTVFAYVLEEDMHVVEKIANLPTVTSTWSGVKVAVLQETVPIKIAMTNTHVASG